MNFEDFDTAPVFAISVVAQLTGMHPQMFQQILAQGDDRIVE